MVCYCCVQGCGNNSNVKKKDPNSVISFHAFPSNQELKTKWLKAIGRPNWTPANHARICSAHFKYEQINYDGCRIRIKDDAVPVNFLPPNSNFEASNVEACRICLATDIELCSLQDPQLGACMETIAGVNASTDCKVEMYGVDFCANYDLEEDRTSSMVSSPKVDVVENLPEQIEEWQKSVIRRTLNSQTEYQCKICYKTFASTHSYQHHIKYHDPCGEKICSRKKHWFHVRRRHPKHVDSYHPIITVICDTCGKGFQNSTKLRIHQLRHSTPKVRCAQCPRLFYDKYALNRHAQTHSEEKPHQCRICGRAFKLLSNLERHARNLDLSNNKNVSLSLIAEYGASDSDSDDTETRSNDNNTDSDATDLTEMVLKNNIINACAHGPLSRQSARDDADVSRHMIIDSVESGVVEYEVTEYRDVDTDSDNESSSDSSDSDVDSVKDIEEVSSGDEADNNPRTGKPEAPKVNGEMGLDDLPPIEDLAISLPAQDTTKIGTIVSIVDRLVIVRALPETPAVDLDSVLFLEKGAKALGRVFDVFGPVTEPHYCVRFNSVEHVRERGAQPGADVYIAPQSQHTNYVFLTELMKIKGSDASWLHDVEPPPHQVEYSDDEEERRANRARKEQRRDRTDESEDGETSKNTRKFAERRNQRPSESSSRFGSGPSRGRNPFAAGSRRNNNPNAFPRKLWPGSLGLRTPQPHPPGDPRAHGPFTAPPFAGPPMFLPPPFNPTTPPPPFMGNMFQFGAGRMPGSPLPIPVSMVAPFRHNLPVFGSNYCTVSGPQPQWVNNGPPPPPGT
ncbi:hypothetical protein SFRURICE_018410 [Spodoptera frugiperda]|nr:hypothetical protein SFRURICE_018410 [Spodoptera frugiperda]